MAETPNTPPPSGRSSGGGGLRGAERWVGQHKVVALGGGAVALILLLSLRGKNVTIPGTVVQATPTDNSTGDTSTAADTTGDDPTLPADPTPPPDPTPPTDTPTDTAAAPTPTPTAPPAAAVQSAPIAAPATPRPAPAAAPPPAAQPTYVPPTISTVPPPAPVQAKQAVTYTDVPGYYTRMLGYSKSTGAIREWHHYTSGTRKGDLVMSGVVGQYPKNQHTPPAGWTTAHVLAGHEDWESPQGSVQYEVTHQAAVNHP